MIGFGKLIIFVFASLLFIYLIYVNCKVLKNFIHKKMLCAFMISGLGLILVGSFLNMISNFINIKFKNLITISFTTGVIIFVPYIILWINHMVNVMCKLNKYAYSDSMTGLYNRLGFEKVYKNKIARNQAFYIMVFDLDKTKIINDNFGHIKGDQYIISAAKIINDQIGENGFVARTGGDEFVALIENMSEAEIEKMKILIKNRVSHIFYKKSTCVSIGYSKYKRDGMTYKELLNSADERMYEDKKKQKESLCNDKLSII